MHYKHGIVSEYQQCGMLQNKKPQTICRKLEHKTLANKKIQRQLPVHPLYFAGSMCRSTATWLAQQTVNHGNTAE